MGVRDLTPLALHSVVIVNSDVAASQQVADRYCAMYGIPTGNQFVYAMGTNVLWEYTADRYASFWTDLYNKVIAVGAYAVFTTAGCPVGIEFLNVDGSEAPAGDGINFSLLVGFVKRIHAYGYEPRILNSGGFYPMMGFSWDTPLHNSVANHKGTQTTDATNVATALQVGLDSLHTSAGGGTSQEYQFTTYKAGWNGDYSIMDNLLTGHIGYATLVGNTAETTHPATLWDLSRVILGKAGNLQIPVASQSSRVVLVCPEPYGADPYMDDSKQALIGKKLQNLGLDVKYWYSGTPSAAAEALLPVASEFNWTTGQLDASTASPTCTYTLALGFGFENVKQTTWKPTMIPSTSGGVFCGGKSYGDRWGKVAMVDGGHSFIQHIESEEYGWHQGPKYQSKFCDIWLNLIAGRTLAEAAWCGLEYSFLAIGDPLCKPFPT